MQCCQRIKIANLDVLYLANTAYNVGTIFLRMGKYSLKIVVIISNYVTLFYEQSNIYEKFAVIHLFTAPNHKVTVKKWTLFV